MDAWFEAEGYKFNVRSSAIIKDKDNKKVILSNMRGITDHEAFILPGGRPNLLEDTEQAIKREIEEELHVDLDFKLISVEENFVESNKFHMLEFVYYAEIESFDCVKVLDDGWDKFKIVAVKDIDNVDVRPKTIKNLIKSESYSNITHNINYDWAD